MTSATRRDYIPVGSTAASMLPMVSEVLSPLTIDRSSDDWVRHPSECWDLQQVIVK